MGSSEARSWSPKSKNDFWARRVVRKQDGLRRTLRPSCLRLTERLGRAQLVGRWTRNRRGIMGAREHPKKGCRKEECLGVFFRFAYGSTEAENGQRELFGAFLAFPLPEGLGGAQWRGRLTPKSKNDSGSSENPQAGAISHPRLKRSVPEKSDAVISGGNAQKLGCSEGLASLPMVFL
jgi:hypothetical protein